MPYFHYPFICWWTSRQSCHQHRWASKGGYSCVVGSLTAHRHVPFLCVLTSICCRWLSSRNDMQSQSSYGLYPWWIRMLDTFKKIFIRLLFSSFFLTFGDMISLCGPGHPGTCYVDQVGLELRDFSTGPKGHVPPCPANTAIFFQIGLFLLLFRFFLFFGGGWFLCIFSMLVLYHMHSRQRISSVCRLCFLSTVSFAIQKALISWGLLCWLLDLFWEGLDSDLESPSRA